MIAVDLYNSIAIPMEHCSVASQLILIAWADSKAHSLNVAILHCMISIFHTCINRSTGANIYGMRYTHTNIYYMYIKQTVCWELNAHAARSLAELPARQLQLRRVKFLLKIKVSVYILLQNFVLHNDPCVLFYSTRIQCIFKN